MSSDRLIVELNINLSQFEDAEDYFIPRPEFALQLDKTYTVRAGQDLEIDMVVNASYSHVDDYLTIGTVNFMYVDTSSEPPEMKTELLRISDAIGIRLENLTSESTNVHITLKHKCARFGGYLAVHNKHYAGSFLRVDFFAINIIKVLSPERKEAIRENTVGLLDLPSNIKVSGPYPVALSCIAMGNPKPEVSIIKLQGNEGTEILTDAYETISMSTEAITQKIIWLSGSDPATPGSYICRAKSRTMTVERAVRVYMFQLAVFDDSLTGVTKNTTDEVVISCQASGKPRPRLDFLQYNGLGLNVLETHQVSRTQIDNTTERATVTIIPREPNMPPVYCTALQAGHSGVPVDRRIDIFPGQILGYTNYTLDLYN